MIICYYTDKSGAIIRTHGVFGGKTESEMRELAKSYNEKGYSDTAHVVVTDDDGLLAYLFMQTHRREKAKKIDRDYALGLVRDLESAIYGLFE